MPAGAGQTQSKNKAHCPARAVFFQQTDECGIGNEALGRLQAGSGEPHLLQLLRGDPCRGGGGFKPCRSGSRMKAVMQACENLSE